MTTDNTKGLVETMRLAADKILHDPNSVSMKLGPASVHALCDLIDAQAARISKLEEARTRDQWLIVRTIGFSPLIDALQRAEDKGYLPDALRAEWSNFQYDVVDIIYRPVGAEISRASDQEIQDQGQ